MSMKVDPTWSCKQAKHLYVDPTWASEQSYTWFWIENGSEGCVVERSGELVLAQSYKLLEVSTQLPIGYLQIHGVESGSKMRSNQNVHESWSYLKSRESQTFACWPHPSLWAIMHMIWIWEWFRGMCCGNHSNDLQKDPGNWCLHGHAQEFLRVCSSWSKVQISRRFGIIAVFIEWMNGQSKEQGS